jgi:hypothetical protein
MRFDKDTRALVKQAGEESPPRAVSIDWPSENDQPRRGKTYWITAIEDLPTEEEIKARAKELRAEKRRLEGRWKAQGLTKQERRRKWRAHRRWVRKTTTRRGPRTGDPRLIVLDFAEADDGWSALVVLETDPVRSLRIKAKVPRSWPGKPTGEFTETEPEPMEISDHYRRLALENKMKANNADQNQLDADVLAKEKKLLDQRRRGKASRFAEDAAKRARRRASRDADELIDPQKLEAGEDADRAETTASLVDEGLTEMRAELQEHGEARRAAEEAGCLIKSASVRSV